MKHHKLIVASAIFFLVSLLSIKVSAGPYTNDLAKCLVVSTSEADKNNLVKWMFAAISSHPEVESMISISQTQREELNQTFTTAAAITPPPLYLNRRSHHCPISLPIHIH